MMGWAVAHFHFGNQSYEVAQTRPAQIHTLPIV
jgi:hypothetical protein